MSVKFACFVGCLVTLAVLAALIGITGLLTYESDLSDYEDLSVYKYNVSCNLTAVSVSIGGSGGSSSCFVWRYTVDVGRLPPGTDAAQSPLGSRTAYGNFYPTRCYGRYLNASQIGQHISGCFAADSTSSIVRIIGATPPDHDLLVQYSVCLACGVAILVIFFIYNCVLWVGVCADCGPFSRENRMRREAMLNGEHEVSTGEGNEPFAVAEIKPADDSWWAEMALDNPFARAVLRRFAPLTAADAAQREASATPMEPTMPIGFVSATVTGGTPTASPQHEHPSTHPNSGEVVVVVQVQPREDSSVDNSVGASDECCICYDRFDEAVVFPCLHYICPTCVERLARNRRNELFTCPICRRCAFSVELRRVFAVPGAQHGGAQQLNAPH